MPEIPDLQLFCRNLKKQLAGRRVESVKIGNPRHQYFKPAEITNALRGARVDEIRREGKQIVFEFDNDRRLAVHLMLHGEFQLVAKPSDVRFAMITIKFDRGESLAVADWSRWTLIRLDPEPDDVPDALSPKLTVKYLKEQIARKPKLPTKSFLIDQDVISGIGNAYSDEILYKAKIAPQSPVGRLPDAAIKQLHQAIRSVLKHAIKKVEQHNPDAINGKPRDFLLVHKPKTKETATGHQIQVKMIGNRKTYFTDEQRLYR